MSYEGEAFGIVPVGDVELPGDVADWLIRMSGLYGQSPGEWISSLIVTYVRVEMAMAQDSAQRIAERIR